MKSKILILSFALIFSFGVIVSALNHTVTDKAKTSDAEKKDPVSLAISAYRFYKDVGTVSVKVPTVIEVPFAADFIEHFNFAVLNKTTNSFEPHFFKQETLVDETPLSVTTDLNVPGEYLMIDKNTSTYADFLLPENAPGQVQITLHNAESKPITSSSLTVLLDDNVALPTSVEIRALVDGQNRIVVANTNMYSQTIRFPKTTSYKWQINFTYSQPLRISELRLNQDNVTKSSTQAIRFLAQPGNAYRIYFDPDRSVTVPVGEAGNLYAAQDVLIVQASGASQNNPNYVIADIDGDKVPDITDNCVSISNTDQKDVNNNKRGDVCDDFDQDGLINSQDNCPDNPNRDQADTDGDKIGDACDKEESRVTERNPWIPWLGMGFAAIVLIVLFALTVRATLKAKKEG